MVDKINIELDGPFLTKFFGLTDRIIPENQEISLLMLRNQLNEVEAALSDYKKELSEYKVSSEFAKPAKQQLPPIGAFEDIPTYAVSEEQSNMPQKNILIIDDLGVITYQLSVLFKQFGFDVVTSREIYDAIEKFKKQEFDLVIMDLFIPTEREGLILLEELKKTAVNKQINVKIGVMSASGKKEHKQLCKMKGAEFYVEKADDWQKELFRVIKELKY